MAAVPTARSPDRSRAAALVLLFTAACAPRAEHPADLTPEATLDRVLERVVEVRGLKERWPTGLRVLEDRAFADALERTRRAGQPALPERAPQESGFAAAAQFFSEARALQHEQTIAFYDPARRSIFVRQKAAESTLPLSWIVAHEVVHALQHQYFGLPEDKSFPTGEAELAYRALLEGDAMVTMLAYRAGEVLVPVRRVVASAIEDIRGGSMEKLEEVSRSKSALQKASPLIRQRFLFPYAAGTVFVGLIHRAGGFELVNRVYEHPPVTTEQVLHPEKYLLGETAARVEAPEPPPGYNLEVTGHFGELHTRALLEECGQTDLSAQAAAGWGGDAFVLARGRGGARLALWSTSWDTEADAREFERAIKPCFGPQRDRHVQRRDAKVSVLSGPVTADEAKTLHQHIATRAVERPRPAPPLGAVSIPPFRTVTKTQEPYVSGGSYIDPRFALHFPVPPGFHPRVEDGHLSAQRDSPPGLLVVESSEWLVTTQSVARIYDDVEDQARPYTQGRDLVVVSNKKISTRLGRGLERTWQVEGTAVGLRAVVLPVCRGTGSVVFLMMWADEHTKQLLTWVVQEARRTGTEPPACALLDP